MRAHVVEDGVIINTIEVDSLDFMPGLVEATGDEGKGWLFADGQFTQPDKTPADIQAEITDRIQSLLDAKAQEYRYDNIHTACGWADKFDDALALKTWGAACWLKAKQIEQEVLAGTREMPQADEVMAELPAFTEDI